MRPRLKQVRERHEGKFTQDDMAEKLGVSVSTYQKWEQGQRELKAPDIIRICKILGVTSDDILGTDYSSYPSNNCIDMPISEDEQEMLRDFRKLDNTDKIIVRGVISLILRERA
jgi:transcriptional regulator with XRE-family HTH domain